MAIWQQIDLQPHKLIGSSDLAAHQPFDIDDWAAKWQPRLLAVQQKVVVVHHTAIENLGHAPIEQITAAWDSECRVLVLDHEGMTTSIRDLATLVDSLVNIGMLPKQILLWSDAGQQTDTDISYGQSLTAFSNPDTNAAAIRSDSVTHHWVMLARVPRRHRLLAACDLIDRGLEKYGKMSCGSGGYQGYSYGPDEFQLAPAHLRSRFPIYLDGKIDSSNMAMHTDSVTLSAVTDAFAQLVCESNWEDPDPVVSDRWKIMQLTEKSSKPLLLGQVFIINSARHTLKTLRDLSFDCFDDVIDHAYDNQSDPLLRVRLVVDQLEKLCQMPLQHWQNWRTVNEHRLASNRQRFLDIASDMTAINQVRFQNALADIDIPII